jgi:hypothetical protein
MFVLLFADGLLPASHHRALAEHLQHNLLALQDVGGAAEVAVLDHSAGVQAPLGDDVVVGLAL